MKSTRPFFLLLLFSFSLSTLFAVKTVSVKTHDLNTMSVEDFMGMKFKEFKNISSQKLSLADKVGFIATKRYFKSKVKKGELNLEDDYLNAAGGFQFKIGPFIVGGIFGLLGLLLVVLLVKKPRKNAVISCVLGMVLWGIIISSLRIF